MSIRRRIQDLQSQLTLVMLKDRAPLSRGLHKISQSAMKGKGLLRRLEALEKRAKASIREKEDRLLHRPPISYPENLPITLRRHEIIHALETNQVIIISGETGCGKSTQIPKLCLEAGRGIIGKIGCTQPRRIAATSIARRIAEEMGEELGRSVGYKIRFQEKGSRDVYIKMMTDGILLAETQGDPYLYEYDTLIIDEAHERSLNIDFLLGILRTLLPERPDLKVVISSATLDTEKFVQALGGAPVVQAGGRIYPVAVEYMPTDPELEEAGEVTYVDVAVKAMDTIHASRPPGDVLIFMPTEQDVIETCERLEGRQYADTAVIPLFARLPASEQGRIYSVKGQKIVVATNVAETSLTIPGIRYVIDTGLARIARYLPRTRTKSLPISPISRSSADQRKGRCGRVQSGVCIRLYSEEDYESRPAFTLPEILRSNLAEVILRMIYLNLGNPASFPFLDPPAPRSIKDGYDLLLELGAIVKEGDAYALTERGRVMARMPLDPRISRMMIEAVGEECTEEVAIIGAALSIQDPRERPAEKAALADQMHRPFRDPDSDFLSLLNIWNRFHREWEELKTQNRMRKFCRAHFLSFPRMREWVYTHEQITSILKEQKIAFPVRKNAGRERPVYARIHHAVLSGFLSNIAVKKDKNIYLAAKGKEVMVFPGSTLFNKNAPWIVAAEMVKTSRLFARTAAKIDHRWLEALGGDLCRSTYSDPHWDAERGEVRAFETVFLYGLPIVSRRPVSFGPIDPELSHRIFIQSALVEGNVNTPLPFLTQNLELIKRLSAMEDKLRRRDILAGETVRAAFYSGRLEGIYDLRTLKKMIREKGSDDFLKMRDEDLVIAAPDRDELAKYPDEIKLNKFTFETSYRFAPGRQDDGVTLRIPSGLAPKIPVERLEWRIPGLLKEKVGALLKGLPKRYRKRLVPIPETVELVLKEMPQEERALLTTLADFIYRKFGVDIPASVWEKVEIPDHLRMRFSLIDHKGREFQSTREFHLLTQAHSLLPSEKSTAAWKKAREEWERTDVKAWDFDTLPERISLGAGLVAYPGLETRDEGVNIRLFQSPGQAIESHVKGVRALLSRLLAKDLKFLKRNLTPPKEAIPGAGYFGGKAAVEEALHETLMKTLLQANLRTREAFNAKAEMLRASMIDEGMRLRDLSAKILEGYHQTRSTLDEIERAAPASDATKELRLVIEKDLEDLVPNNFLEHYSMERLASIPRYLKAMQIRAERGANAPEKDRIKMSRAEPSLEALRRMKEGLSDQTSKEKREAVETYRWMVEEFKISLFAQEMKTLFPISEKRLQEKRKEIERML